MNDTDKRKNSKTVIGSLTKRQIWNMQSRLQMIGVQRCFGNSFRAAAEFEAARDQTRVRSCTRRHGCTCKRQKDKDKQTQSHIHTDGHASLTHCPETDFVYKPQQLMYRPKTSGILF